MKNPKFTYQGELVPYCSEAFIALGGWRHWEFFCMWTLKYNPILSHTNQATEMRWRSVVTDMLASKNAKTNSSKP